MSSLAQEESRSVSENVTWGHRKRIADGKVCVPYRYFLGYDKGPDGNLAVNKEQARTVKLIYRLFLDGYTFHRIIYRCNDKFKSHCKTPHLTEVDIKEAFVRIANQRCRFLLFQYTMTAQICKEKGEPAYAHGGVQNPCYRSIVSNTDTFEIRAANGEELLIHIGIDTVKLNGKFFKSCVKQEQAVKKDNLIEETYNAS